MTSNERKPLLDVGRVRKIAVLRANALGDFVFSLPALTALKRHFRNAELVYLGKPWHRDFLRDRPGPVDRTVVVPVCHGVPEEGDRVKDPAAVEAFFTGMEEERFDLAFQMHGGGGNSNPFLRKLGAACSIGLQADGAPPLDINIPYFLYQPEVLRYLDVARAAGAVAREIEPRLAVTREDEESLLRVAAGLERRVAVLHPGATDPRRRWAAGNFAAVGDRLAQDGHAVVITGSDGEAGLAKQVAFRMRHAARNLAGQLSLGALTALLARAQIVVSNDTGPLHLARAVATRTVGIYWIGNIITGGPVSTRGHRCCISWQTHCPRCGADCVHGDARSASQECAHDASFVDEVSVAEVTQAVHELQGQGAGAPGLRVGCA